MPRRTRRNPNGYPPPPNGQPPAPPAPQPQTVVVKKDRWGWAKWIGGGIILGIAGWEGLRWWKKVRGVRNPDDGEDGPRQVAPAGNMATPQLPQVIPFPMPVPQLIPMPGMMNPFQQQSRVVEVVEDDEFEELADRKRKNKAKRAKRMAAIMESFEEDDD